MTAKEPNKFLRKADLPDASDLSELCAQTFSETYSSQNKPSDIDYYIQHNFNLHKITEELNDPDTVFYLAFDNHVSAGYIKLTVRLSKTEISRIYVRKQYFGNGLAQQLIQTAKEYTLAKGLNTLYLAVWQQNHRAVAFYKKSGFIITGITLFDWGTGKLDEDFEMELNL